MVRVSTFCPRCGESIETELPEDAKAAGHAELGCPACRFEFVIAPARGATPSAPPTLSQGGLGPIPPAGGNEPSRPVFSPDPSARRRPVTFKPIAAGLMLVFVAMLGVWGGISVFTGDIVEASLETGNITDFSGRVVDPENRPLEGVRVEMAAGPDVDEGEGRTATTDEDGRYGFEGIRAGIYTFRFSAENRTTVLLEAPAYPADYARLFGDALPFGQVTMAEGDPSEVRETSQVEWLERFARGWAWFTIVAAAVTLVGGWAAVRRKGFPLAVVGAVAGMLAGLMFLIGSLLALIALILLIVARKEFEPLGKPKDQDPARPY